MLPKLLRQFPRIQKAPQRQLRHQFFLLLHLNMWEKFIVLAVLKHTSRKTVTVSVSAAVSLNADNARRVFSTESS